MKRKLDVYEQLLPKEKKSKKNEKIIKTEMEFP